MEFENQLRGLWALFGLILWCCDYLRLGKKPSVIYDLATNRTGKKIGRGFVFILGVFAWCLLAIALMGPRKPDGFSKNQAEVNDVFMVVDVSRSMLAEDFKPNRLEVAKKRIIDFVSLRPTDRIGIIMFSERAFTLLPLSTDLDLVRKIVSDIDVGFLGMGTNIGDALALAIARLNSSQTKNRVIVLLTDGVSNVGSMTPLQAAEEAQKDGIKIYAIGVGSEENSRVLRAGGGYQMIPGGSVDFPGLQEISRMTGGKSYLAQSPEALEKVLNEIQQLEKTKIELGGRVLYKELYMKYLIPALMLLVLVELSRKWVMREAV
jgi:Ca-activated chloride channel family protein